MLKAEIVRLSVEGLSPSEIMQRTGASRQHVQQTRAECGFVTPLRQEPRRLDRILQVLAENPDFGNRKVAQATGIDRRDVQRILARYRKDNHVALTGAATPDQRGLQSVGR